MHAGTGGRPGLTDRAGRGIDRASERPGRGALVPARTALLAKESGLGYRWGAIYAAKA